MAYVKQAHKTPTKSFAFKKIIEEVKNNKALIALLTKSSVAKPPMTKPPVAATATATAIGSVTGSAIESVTGSVACDDATQHFPHLDFHTQIIAFGDYLFTVSLPLQLSTHDGLRVFYPHVWQTYDDWLYDSFWDIIETRESMYD